jgi:hypothetical protein
VPKLSAFAACGQILQDDKGNASAIQVFAARVIVPHAGQEIAANAFMEIPWYILSVWTISESEIQKNYVLKCVILLPDGEAFGGVNLPFTTITRSHTLKLSIPGLPVGKPGEFTIKLWIEQDGKKITDDFAFPFLLLHEVAKEVAKTDGV